MIKQATFGSAQDRFRQHLKATSDKTAGIATTQGTQESGSVSLPTSDPEVKDMLPAGGQPGGGSPQDLGGGRQEFNEKVPGQVEPSKEEKKREETAPGSKLANDISIGDLTSRLAGNLKLAADQITADLQKSASGGLPAPGSDDSASVPAKPSGGTDLSMGSPESAKADTSGSTPVIQGAQGVTQTTVPGGTPSTTEPQGTSTEKVKMASPAAGLDIDQLAEKTARFFQNFENGRKLAFLAAGLSASAAQNPADQDLAKQAELVETEFVFKTAAQFAGLGLEQGIITEQQADAMMKAAGFVVHPLVAAVEAVQEKVAALANSGLTPDQQFNFIAKCASNDAAMAAGAQGGPVAPDEMHAALAQLLQQLHQAVVSGQMSEEQAMQVLREQGLPVDQLLSQAGAVGEPAGGAAGGAAAAVGGAMGASPEGSGAMGGDAMGGAPMGAPTGGGPGGGSAIPAIDPAAGAAGAPAMDPTAGAAAGPIGGAAPSPDGAPATPPIGGDPAAIGEPAPGAPEAPKPDTTPKKEEGGKSEGGDKKDDKKDDKKEEKKDDDKGDKKEAHAILNKLATFLGVKIAEGEPLPGGASDAVAGESVAASPEAAAPTPPDGGGAGAPAPGGPQGGSPDGAGTLGAVMQDLEAAAASGALPPEIASQIKDLLMQSAAGGAGGAAAPAGPAGPGASPAAM